MTQVPQSPGGGVNHEQRLYRREAIDFQRYRFIGEPLRTGRASLAPVAAALAMLVAGIAAVATASHRPGLGGRVSAGDARSVSMQLDTPRGPRLVRAGDPVTLALPRAGERDGRVAAVEGRAVRLDFAPRPAPGAVRGERAVLRLSSRPLPLMP